MSNSEFLEYVCKDGTHRIQRWHQQPHSRSESFGFEPSCHVQLNCKAALGGALVFLPIRVAISESEQRVVV